MEIPTVPLTSLELLNQRCAKVKRLREETFNEPLTDDKLINVSSEHQHDLCTASIMKLAKAQLLKFKSRKIEVLSYVASLFGPQSGFSSEVPESLELAMLLQAAAEKVANRKFSYARKLLNRCFQLASKNGNPLQRVVYNFSEALQKKIDREWGICFDEQDEKAREPLDVEQTKRFMKPEMVQSQQEIPFRLEAEIATCQPILNSAASAKKVHLIDLGIENGSHWIPIMQSFASRYECPLELLKITAVGTSRELLEVTGKWLSSFAETIDLPFSFQIVISDLKNLKEDFFELQADEVVVFYSSLRLWTLLPLPTDLEVVLGVIKNLNPRLLIVKEMEASTNSSIFLERFHETLLLLSGMFDNIKECLDHQILFRKITEEILQERIQNIITAEGAQRIHRYEKLPYWRALFKRFGMVETELTRSSLSQAKWLLTRSPRFKHCTLYMDGKCLIMGWRGTPFMSLSAWKFKSE